MDLPRPSSCGERWSKPASGRHGFTRGQLYQILKNVIYTGKIGHKGKLHDGLHVAIIEQSLFDAVQTMLADHCQGHRSRAAAAEASLLAGRVVDEAGEPLIATHACKPVLSGVEGGRVRHRYYVSRALHHGSSDTGVRLPARELESLVTDRLVQLLADPLDLAATMALEVTPHLLTALPDRCAVLAGQLGQRRPALVPAIVTTVEIKATEIVVSVDLAALTTALDVERPSSAPAILALPCTARLTRSGRALRLVQDNGALTRKTPDKSLVRLLVQARRWWSLLRTGEIGIAELAAREGVSASYATRVVRLAFLAPAVTEAILAGRQRAGVTAASLRLESIIPADWQAQKAAFLPAR